MAKAKYTCGSDGYYQTKVWDGTYNDDGTKHRITLRSSKSSRDLENQVNNLKAKVESRSNIVPAKHDVWTYANEWLSTFKANKSLNTIKMYDRIITNHMDAFKGVTFSALSVRHIQAAVTAVYDRPRTCQQLIVTLKQVVKSAIRERYLPAGTLDDLFDGIDTPKYQPGEKRALTPAEKDAIFSAGFTLKQKAFVYTLYYTGIRRGEALALTRDDINVTEKYVNIDKSIAFNDNTGFVKDPKSYNGFRHIPMPEPYLSFMIEYLPQLTGPYLFSMGNGEIMSKSSFNKFWKQIFRQINLAAGGTDDLTVLYDLTPHVFRHNYCTEMCYQVPAISFNTIAEWLGDTKAMVVEVYSHAMSEKENVNEILKKVFGDSKRSS